MPKKTKKHLRVQAWKLKAPQYCSTLEQNPDNHKRLWRAVLIQAVRDYCYPSVDVDLTEVANFFHTEAFRRICNIVGIAPRLILDNINHHRGLQYEL